MVSSTAPAGGWQAATIELAAFLVIPVLTLAPRGTPILLAISGIAAATLVWSRGSPALSSLRPLAILLGVLLVLGIASAAWAINPERSLIVAVRLVGIFTAGLALAAAASLVNPQRLLIFLVAGTLVGITLAMVELATGGMLSRVVFVRPFYPTRINFAAMMLAILIFPLATAAFRTWGVASVAIAAAMAAAVYLLKDTTAKATLPIGVCAAALFYLVPRAMPRLAAGLSVLVVLTAPVTFPRLQQLPQVVEAATAFKGSEAHRLLIWSFAGARIAEHPLIGWGLDASRDIPGGTENISPRMPQWLPVHPHNDSLELWLELGVSGATLFALLLAFLFVALGRSGWSRPYLAACGASMAVALAPMFNAWGIWNEIWQGMLWFSAFFVLSLSRLQEPESRPSRSPVIGALPR